MHVGMPGGGERQMQVIGKRRSEHAVFAGAGDVDDVRTEFLERANDQREMANESRVEGEAFVEIERQDTAAKFECLELTFNKQAGLAIPGTHAEKWKRTASRKGFKLAAGVGNTIDFVERVWEVSDP